MRKPSWGPVVKERVRKFLQALLLEPEQLYGKMKWEEKDSRQLLLIVKTKRNILETITELKQYELYETINCLKILGLFDDRRFNKSGTDEWYFALKTPSRDIVQNLNYFEKEWENRKQLAATH